MGPILRLGHANRDQALAAYAYVYRCTLTAFTRWNVPILKRQSAKTVGLSGF